MDWWLVPWKSVTNFTSYTGQQNNIQPNECLFALRCANKMLRCYTCSLTYKMSSLDRFIFPLSRLLLPRFWSGCPRCKTCNYIFNSNVNINCIYLLKKVRFLPFSTRKNNISRPPPIHLETMCLNPPFLINQPKNNFWCLIFNILHQLHRAS